ncbi:high frequency lysogenization protein HflD [Marinimicrobium sp. ABcell2]|uniref:high frequency lysogenization protein HflD n=1 Tax=Marinimicrobium sp. ABcell2 TaxID=3069751 RepID=UPI0027B199A5|nr:high frequency lysogenization protein HflD [Marinimicrobium sp. ABcell2]MDQ2077227.1 high frequency lysogenization protein HflD [Marinimicrobium sp. ABcell2]
MSKNWHDITLALAGIFQASALVEQLAKTGYVPNDAYRCSIGSLFILDPPDTLSVYGNLGDMQLGLEILQETLSPGNQRPRDALRYTLGILHLQKKLKARKDMMGVLGTRLKQAARQAEHFTPTHDNVIGNLGDLYKETLSTFRFRIQVTGDQGYLQQPRVANQVRALLLAGIRSATLWRQVGGNRWQLLLQRKRLANTVHHLLKEAKAENARNLH